MIDPASAAPSDADLISLAYDCNAMPECCTDAALVTFARAAIARWSQPTPPAADIEAAARLALGILWMDERVTDKTRAAFQILRDALGGHDGLRKGIEAAIRAGYEADHPPGADWWAGKKEAAHGITKEDGHDH